MQGDDDHADLAKAILKVFAQYGFRKTSMDAIGQAAQVSRQSVYKKFGSKAACYEWATNTYLANMYRRIFAALSQEDAPPNASLSKVFDIFVGESIDLIANQHGMEILTGALEATYASEHDWPLRFRTRLGEYLHHNHLAPSREMGIAKAFTLITAAKGLILEKTDREQARLDMRTMVKAVIDDPTMMAISGATGQTAQI